MDRAHYNTDMAAAPQLPLVSEEEYLRTEYEPNCEYVDGVLEPKALPNRFHAVLHGLLIEVLGALRRSHRIIVCPELRLRIRQGLHRLPDITIMPDVYRTDPGAAPLAVFEILSPSDKFQVTRDRIRDLHSIGACWTVIADPQNREVFIAGKDLLLRQVAPPLTVRLPLPERPDLIIDFDALFAELPTEPDPE